MLQNQLETAIVCNFPLSFCSAAPQISSLDTIGSDLLQTQAPRQTWQTEYDHISINIVVHDHDRLVVIMVCFGQNDGKHFLVLITA